MTLADFLSRRKCPACDGEGHEVYVDGGKLREARETAGLTAAAVASKLRISQGYLSQLETGKRPISEGLAGKYLSALSGG